MAEGKNGRETIFGYFWIHFGSRPKMSILPFARGSFENMKYKHPKIGFVTIMLSKRIFGIKKL